MSNSYFTATGNPLTRSLSNSATIRAEFANVQAAFDRLPEPRVGEKGFTNGTFYAPNISNAMITGSTAFYNGAIYADRLACHWTGATFSSPDEAYPTPGIFGAYRTTKTNTPFSLLVSGTSTPDDYLLFDKYSNVIFGNGTSAKATNATDGFLMIPTCAGAPSGTPAHLYDSSVPLIYDSTNNKLYVYDGGWKATAALT